MARKQPKLGNVLDTFSPVISARDIDSNLFEFYGYNKSSDEITLRVSRDGVKPRLVTEKMSKVLTFPATAPFRAVAITAVKMITLIASPEFIALEKEAQTRCQPHLAGTTPDSSKTTCQLCNLRWCAENLNTFPTKQLSLEA